MSYVRFSGDDWTSDVYVFEDVSGGWTTYVAARHWVWDVELPPVVDLLDDADAWYDRNKQILEWFGVEYGHWVGLPDDPGYHHHLTPGECADNLERLQSLGFHVPAGVVDDLRAEQEMTS